jgi:protein-tyrosine phosphatase
MSAAPAVRILFVCTGNICRSPLAHAVFESLLAERGLAHRYEVESAGTTAYHAGDNADPRMRKTAAGHGVHIDHLARQISRDDLEHYDMILAMDRENRDAVLRLARNGEGAKKVRLFREFDPEGGPGHEVPDPYYGGSDGFERVFRIVDRTSRGLLASLVPERRSESV